jgi:hypothetical protein
MLIDWSSLQPYKKTKQKSFEQLCYQIAAKLFKDKGTLTSIDDSGGGDGVEFYLPLDNGEEYGWQAKYYEGSIRLNISNRKQSIINSLKRTLAVHERLEVWYLCLPIDLTPEEREWFDKELPQNIPNGRKIVLKLWDESTLHEMINRPEFNGLKQAFFNRLELSAIWFREKFETLSTIVRNKFDELLFVHNEDFEYDYVHPMLCNESFRENRIGYYPPKLKELYEKLQAETKTLQYTTALFRSLYEKYRDSHTRFLEQFKMVLPAVQHRYDHLTPNSIYQISEAQLSTASATLASIKKELEDYRYSWHQEHMQNRVKTDEESDQQQLRKLYDVEHIYKEIIEELDYYLSHSAMPLTRRIAHYLGSGGTGKTNFCVGLSQEYLQNGWPVIFIPAIKLTAQNPISEQILSLLDIHSGYRFGDFLDCLNELGRIHNIRVPILLDGLNEALNVNGYFNERLASDLPELETEILRRENLVLMTTCRPSYRLRIWPNGQLDDDPFHTIYGFTNQEDKKNLIRKYFSHYKIQADLSFLSLQRFTKPLYLKIFCESINPERKEVKQVTLGFDSIYSIFDNFIVQCDRTIYQKIVKSSRLPPLSSHKHLASQVLDKIAQHLWEHPSRSFSLEELIKLADGNKQVEWNHSITKALLDEELLFIRDWYHQEEVVYLTYDLMAGYFIAKYLLHTVSDFSAFFTSQEQLVALINDNPDKLHPHSEDILDGLCSLLPIHKQVFVHDLIRPFDAESPIHQKLFNKSVSATLLLSPEFIPDAQVEFIKKLARHPGNLELLLSASEEVRFVSNHPFNFSFWAREIKALPMNQRDLLWSEYLRNMNQSALDDLLQEFEYLQGLPHLTDEQRMKILLVSEFLQWTLTTTDGTMKEKSAKALFAFGVQFPKSFFSQFTASVDFNDPSVFEWMNLVLYNVILVIVRQNWKAHQEDLSEVAYFLYHQVLAPKAKYATNDLITRNYAFSTFKLLSHKLDGGGLPSPAQISKDFKKSGIIKWQEAADLNKDDYREGNSLIGYYFDKEKMPYIMMGKGNEYNRTPAYESTQAKLRWRAYKLGYRFDYFGEIDKQIAKYQHYGEQFRKTQRYADKYIEIAYLEFCGFLAAQGKLKSYEEYGNLRVFELKIDPTAGQLIKREPKRLVTETYITGQVTLKEWANNHSVPDVNPFLRRTDFCNDQRPFVLLHGLVHQHSKKDEKQIFFQIDTVLVKNKHLKQARTAFSKSKKFGWAAHSAPLTSHVHESEIPDADTIPDNKFIDWHYSIRSKTVEREYKKINLLRDGELLDEKEADAVWKAVTDSAGFWVAHRQSLADFDIPYIKMATPGEQKEDLTLEQIFQKIGVALQEVRYKQQEEQDIDKKLAVFIPVRQIKGNFYLCKNIINYFHLSRNLVATDLVDQVGALASLNTSVETEYADQETFTYLRQDLLDQYLRDQELTMFTIIWGERDYYPPDGDWLSLTTRNIQRRWSEFYEWREYVLPTT